MLALGLSLVAGTKAVDVDTLLGLKKVSKTESKQQIDLTEAKKSLEALEAEFKVLVADVSARKQLVELYCNEVKLHETLETKLKRKEAADKFVEENKEELEKGVTVLKIFIPSIDKETKKEIQAKEQAFNDYLTHFYAEQRKDSSFGEKVADKTVETKLTPLGLLNLEKTTTNSEALVKATEALKKEVEELANIKGEYQLSLAAIKELAKESHADLQVLFVLAEKKLALLEKLVEKHDLDPKLFDKSCPAPGRLINHPAGEKETKETKETTETTEKKAKKDNVPNTASAAAAASLAFEKLFNNAIMRTSNLQH